jgi:hypothetical protein
MVEELESHFHLAVKEKRKMVGFATLNVEMVTTV